MPVLISYFPGGSYREIKSKSHKHVCFRIAISRLSCQVFDRDQGTDGIKH